MATLPDRAIEALRQLPQNEQNLAAATVIDYAQRDDLLELAEADAAEVRRRMHIPDRTFLSVDDLREQLQFDA